MSTENHEARFTVARFAAARVAESAARTWQRRREQMTRG